MAGRNYSFSGSDPEPEYKPVKHTGSWLASFFDDDDIDIDEDELIHENFGFGTKHKDSRTIPKHVLLSVIIFIAVVTAAGLTIFFVFRASDVGHGSYSSTELTMSVTKALDDFSYDSIKYYIPKQIRDAGFIDDSDTFVFFRAADKSKGLQWKNTVINSSHAVDDTDVLESGIAAVYGRHIPISKAELYNVSVVFTDSTGTDYAVICNIIPISVHGKWYFYTGKPISIDGKSVSFMSGLARMAQIDDRGYDIKYVAPNPVSDNSASVNSVSENVPAEPVLDFYDGAASDLMKGSVSINGVQYSMPASLHDFKAFFVLDEDKLPDLRAAKLAAGNVTGNVPVIFSDADYTGLPFYVAVGNTTQNVINTTDGTVTALYIGKSDAGMPDVKLPGGVTFGTGYSDFCRMYGKPDVVTGTDKNYKGSLSDTVYKFSLKNPHNCIYFGFKDNKLEEVQWYYIDMTNYNRM